MKTLVIATVVLSALTSHADIIKCTFTEPFVDTTYSMTQSTLTTKDASEDKPTVVKNVSFQIKAAGEFELVSREGKVLQTLKLNNQGSNGMSDAVYPYDVQDHTIGIQGGCESNSLKAVEPTEE